jgi:hypothetical protein
MLGPLDAKAHHSKELATKVDNLVEDICPRLDSTFVELMGVHR